MEKEQVKGSWKEVARYFFKLGIVAFGGPAAHVAMMQDDLVEKKKWLDSQEFLNYLGATNLIPGPNSTEMTMHCGHHRAGWRGLIAGGLGFVIPAFSLTLLVAVLFEEYSEIAWVEPIVAGIKAAVLSFIVAAILKLGQKAIKTHYHWLLGMLVVTASFLGINEILCILGAGIVTVLISWAKTGNQLNSVAIFPLFGLFSLSFSQLKMFLIFMKVGAVLFGSGYVLFAYLDGELIDSLGWLTHDDLVEAIAIGQITPGPVLSAATFIGYKLGGVWGAVYATLGIFLPSFVYVWLLNKFVNKMQSSTLFRAFLDAVNVAAVAVMLTVTVSMARSIVVDWKTLLITGLSFAVYFYLIKSINVIWIIVGGGVLGYLLSLI